MSGVCWLLLLQALAESAAQRVGQLEQQVKQLQDTSDANGQVLQGKMSNLDGEPHRVSKGLPVAAPPPSTPTFKDACRTDTVARTICHMPQSQHSQLELQTKRRTGWGACAPPSWMVGTDTFHA